MRHRRTTAALGLAVGATLAAGAAAPAWGARTTAPTVTEITTELHGPLQIDVRAPGQVYLGQTTTGALTRVSLDGTSKDLLTANGEVAGVAARRTGVAYTVTGGTKQKPVAQLRWRSDNGKTKVLAGLHRFERLHNPDHRYRYGFRGLSDACAAKVPAQIGGKPYRGRVDSHPYAVVNARHGWLVADAGANDILRIRRDGTIRVVAVLPPQRLTITSDMATALTLPSCTVGKTYGFEPVPTDIAHSPAGLLASLLPGGPEDQSLGARGKVVRLDRAGRAQVVARGLAGAVNLAVSSDGSIYVAELFANRVSVVDPATGTVTPFVDLNQPGGLDWWKGTLYATRDVLGDNGSLVSVTG